MKIVDLLTLEIFRFNCGSGGGTEFELSFIIEKRCGGQGEGFIDGVLEFSGKESAVNREGFGLKEMVECTGKVLEHICEERGSEN